MIKLIVKMDNQFVLETFKRYRQQHKLRNTWLVLKILLVVIFTFLAILSFFHKDYKLIIFFAAVILFMLYGNKMDHVLLKHRYKNAPYINDQVEINLSDEGYHEISNKFESRLLWGSFTKAIEFCDGFLLMQGPGLFNWLPIKNIAKGSAQELKQLIKDNIKEYKVIERSASRDRRETSARFQD